MCFLLCLLLHVQRKERERNGMSGSRRGIKHVQSSSGAGLLKVRNVEMNMSVNQRTATLVACHIHEFAHDTKWHLRRYRLGCARRSVVDAGASSDTRQWSEELEYKGLP